MEIITKTEGNKATMEISGWLDTQTAPQLGEALSGLEDSITSLVFDFTNLEYISSAGLRQVIVAYKKMAQKDVYIGEAYELLKNLSADEKKRLEYEYREKCIRDHSAAMQSAAQHGFEEGVQKGKSELILNMNTAGYPISEISKIANLAEEEVQEILQKK